MTTLSSWGLVFLRASLFDRRIWASYTVMFRLDNLKTSHTVDMGFAERRGTTTKSD